MISGPRSQQIMVDQRSEALPGFKTLPVLDHSEATRHRQRLGLDTWINYVDANPSVPSGLRPRAAHPSKESASAGED